MRRDLEPVRPDAEAIAELKILTARRADLVAAGPAPSTGCASSSWDFSLRWNARSTWATADRWSC
jgi:hypothetical protein